MSQAVFPRVVICPYGPHDQRVSRPNNFPCLACGGVFRVDENGRVVGLREPGSRGTLPSRETQVAMEFPSDPQLVSPLRRALRQVASGLGLRGTGLGDLELCFEEAVMNIIIHGYGYDRTKPVCMETSLDRNRRCLTLVIRDKGPKVKGGWVVDVAKVRRRVRQRKVGGLGKFLIHELMDHVTLRRERGWNVLTMERSLNGR